MKSFLFSANGLEFGAWAADTQAAAQEKFASDSGYQSWGAMVAQAEEFGGNMVEVRELAGQTRVFTLLDIRGTLYFPEGDDGEPSLLIRRYADGDCDTCPWPLIEPLYLRLAGALFDERETNSCWPIDEIVHIYLPDGTRFDLDAVLHEDDDYEGHQREYNPDNYAGF